MIFVFLRQLLTKGEYSVNIFSKLKQTDDAEIKTGYEFTESLVAGKR